MAGQPKRLLEVQVIDNVAVVTFTATRILDEQVIQQTGEQLNSLVDDAGHQRILLNFSAVEYLSSAALGKLVVLRKKVETVRGKLALCNIDDTIFEAFRITGFDKIFKIFPDEQEALEYLRE